MPEKIREHITVHRNGFDHLQEVLRLNFMIFGEERIINRMDHVPLLFLTGHIDGQLAGFKIGYGMNNRVFYSAKGATSPFYRNRGIATRLLHVMMMDAGKLGFQELQFDTFPSLYPGMTIVGLKNGFQIKKMKWHPHYGDFQVRLARHIR